MTLCHQTCRILAGLRLGDGKGLLPHGEKRHDIRSTRGDSATPARRGCAAYMQILAYMCQNATLGSGFFTM